MQKLILAQTATKIAYHVLVQIRNNVLAAMKILWKYKAPMEHAIPLFVQKNSILMVLLVLVAALFVVPAIHLEVV